MYENRIPEEKKCVACNPERDMSLTFVMREACNKAYDALRMAKKIDQHLFGVMSPDELAGNPSCFDEELRNHDNTLSLLCEELARMMKSLGVDL